MSSSRRVWKIAADGFVPPVPAHIDAKLGKHLHFWRVVDPKGCQKAAGGRSEAKTSGHRRKNVGTLKGCQNAPGPLAPFQGACRINRLIGGVASPTPGYFLPCLRHVVPRQPPLRTNQHHPGQISMSLMETLKNQKSRCSPPEARAKVLMDNRASLWKESRPHIITPFEL